MLLPYHVAIIPTVQLEHGILKTLNLKNKIRDLCVFFFFFFFWFFFLIFQICKLYAFTL